MDHEPAIVVEPTPIALYPQVLALLSLDEAQVDMLLAAAAAGRFTMDGLFHARRGNDHVGVAWGQVVPGRSAFTWPPRLEPGVDASVAARLLRAVDDYLLKAGVSFSQAVLPDVTCADAQRLLAAGYAHFADLDYLACPRSFFPGTRPQLSLDLDVLQDQDEHRFALLIESTYIDTLDCINLDGVRTTSDTIAGYRMTGQYRPDWWLIARQGDVDVGCLIMADHQANDQCELVYMGIVPQARGHGLGRQLVKHALWLAASRERERLVLAVDRRNWPARDIYTQCGFQTWATRSIMIKQYDS